MPKITKKGVDALPAKARAYFEKKKAAAGDQKRTPAYCTWDDGRDSIAGFGVRVQPSGVMTYMVKYRAASGRQRWTRIGDVGTLTPEEAREKAREIKAAVQKGGDPGAKKMTVRGLAERFLTEHIAEKKKRSTLTNYRIVFHKHVLPKLGDCKAEKIGSDDLEQLHRKIKSKHPYQANRVLAAVSSMYGWAAKRNPPIVPPGFNPAKSIERYSEKGRERYLNNEELMRLGEAIREAETIGLPYAFDEAKPTSKHAPKPQNRRVNIGPHAAAAIRLLLFTGARLREILHLKWDEIDFERGLLRLQDSKTGKKTIVLNAPALEILANLPRAADYVIAGQHPVKPRADLQRPWEAVRKRAGLDDVRLHDLRHTHASYGAGASLGLPIIGKLLGHTQAATTQRYAHLADDPLRKASERIASDIAAAMSKSPEPVDGDDKVLPMRSA